MLKQKVLKIYQNKCAVSHFNVSECDLAHIVPRTVSLKHQNNPSNCLLLSSSLHRLFDKFLWTFDIFSVQYTKKGWCNLEIIISNKILHKHTMITSYKSNQIELPVSSLPFLYCHYRVFFNVNYTSYYKTYTVQQMYDYYLEDCFLSVTNLRNRTGKYIAIVDHKQDFSSLLIVWEGMRYADRSWQPKANVTDRHDLDMYIRRVEESKDPTY